MSSQTAFERNRPAASLVADALRDSRPAVFWLDGLERPARPTLTGGQRADLVVVGGGYTGLWTAVRAKERDPDRSVIVLEAHEVGWAASGRNGGFCDASLTHGEENGRRRWPAELDQLDRLGADNLDGIEQTVQRYEMAVEFERTGELSVAVEPHQVEWLAGADGFLDAEAVRAEVNSPTYLAGAWSREGTALLNPGRMALELARVAEQLGVEIYEHSAVTGIERGERPTVRTERGWVNAERVALATNVFPSLLKRNRLMTVPVYDYALVTEPLSQAQLAEIGWRDRQGLADLANQFHYYRLTADNRILFGGYDAIYPRGGRLDSAHEERPATFTRLGEHFFTTFPQLAGLGFSHRWAGAIDTSTQFCAFYGTAAGGHLAYAAGFTGLGVAATRFAADVMLDLLGGCPTERTELEMVRRRPLPFPPDPIAALGIGATKWALDRADHNQGKRNLLLKALDAVGLGFDS
ncbi:FAD-binding oxidoreductase [Propionicimonas sp.]|uniref:NAD(P)/FAD-dependent oxidoreductase n=1 Tax=Propionicimonas sp. TaxID=1955623 RepID=UPI0017D3AEC4|nr:FAD-dependent oxidoreductase [Propionicimonas sp.]MBU3976641.1 FAD-binding oxidoreductase [Actinomycetota bacterium]MBA3020359.1 FAD-dependent oxidoreductase [Propionicimonas sp.]MBU3986532.1 FAD-binding oxidoreductase [Actinomycetota bacterium]MBU4007316.1 FAD-binding oxidoreductase [Actinomycetota bacterium]MBU4065069.1 FAD-binding oxidoreductase [Actinomycetota bacterium]